MTLVNVGMQVGITVQRFPNLNGSKSNQKTRKHTGIEAVSLENVVRKVPLNPVPQFHKPTPKIGHTWNFKCGG